jgi:hypothetical protein
MTKGVDGSRLGLEVLRIPVDTEYIRGVGRMGDRPIIMLDLGRVISAGEKIELQKLGAAA